MLFFIGRKRRRALSFGSAVTSQAALAAATCKRPSHAHQRLGPRRPVHVGDPNDGRIPLRLQIREGSQKRADFSIAVAIYVPEIGRDGINEHDSYVPELSKFPREGLYVPLKAEGPV